jgi:hypothetical protein
MPIIKEIVIKDENENKIKDIAAYEGKICFTVLDTQEQESVNIELSVSDAEFFVNQLQLAIEEEKKPRTDNRYSGC